MRLCRVRSPAIALAFEVEVQVEDVPIKDTFESLLVVILPAEQAGRG
jgi:hypothetical protein